jgi:hypothetical protein
MWRPIFGAELRANEIRKSWLTQVVPEPSCAEQQVRSVILDYKLCVYFAMSSQVDFSRKSIYYTLPRSIPSPDRNACPSASNKSACSQLRNQTVACAVVLVNVVDWQLFSVALRSRSVKDSNSQPRT